MAKAETKGGDGRDGGGRRGGRSDDGVLPRVLMDLVHEYASICRDLHKIVMQELLDERLAHAMRSRWYYKRDQVCGIDDPSYWDQIGWQVAHLRNPQPQVSYKVSTGEEGELKMTRHDEAAEDVTKSILKNLAYWVGLSRACHEELEDIVLPKELRPISPTHFIGFIYLRKILAKQLKEKPSQ